MRIEARFLRSCSALEQLPQDRVPEAAVLGRSNVGKSSLLNRLLGKANLAKVSATPGRTRLLNVFDVRGFAKTQAREAELRLVDCPGYGYAKVAHTESAAWGQLMRSYLETRQQLQLCLLLVDGMLPERPMDCDLHAWLRAHDIPALLIATKWDRLTRQAQALSQRRLNAAYGETVIGFSAVTGTGTAAILTRLKALTQTTPDSRS